MILRCLEKDPNKRFRDIAELAEALQPYAPERSAISVRRVIAIGASQPYSRRLLPEEVTPNVGPPATDPTRMQTEPPVTRRGLLRGVLAGVLLVAGAFVGSVARCGFESTGGTPLALKAAVGVAAAYRNSKPEVRAQPAGMDAGALSAHAPLERAKANTAAARGNAAIMPATTASASRRRAITPKAFSRAGEGRAVDPLGDRE